MQAASISASNPRQSLRFCTAADGTRIAIASIGAGPPLLRAAHWLSHVEHDVHSPVWRPWLTGIARNYQYIRYDLRGCGLSDRDVQDQSLDVWLTDLEAVVDALGLERFPLIGMSQGGAIAISYALRHPERVTHLVLLGAYARGCLRRELTAQARLEAETLVNMIRIGWGGSNAAFREAFTNQFIPGGTATQLQWWTELQQLTASPEMAARILEAFYGVDVVDEAAKLRVPTLVLHARGDIAVPFDEVRRLAALIPGARFVPLESDNHVLLDTEPAWATFMAELRCFLGTSRSDSGDDGSDHAALTPAERKVLRLVALGLDNHAIARQLNKSEKTVRNQMSSIFDKLGVRTRAEAIVHVRNREDVSAA